jgi:hypothetical protein
MLAASFVCFGRDARWIVGHDDSRFHLVAVLATWTAAASASELAVLQQVIDWNSRRMAFGS